MVLHSSYVIELIGAMVAGGPATTAIKDGTNKQRRRKRQATPSSAKLVRPTTVSSLQPRPNSNDASMCLQWQLDTVTLVVR